MKTTRLLLLIGFLGLMGNANSQIVLEHTYPGPRYDFFIAKLSSGFKYIKTYAHTNADSGYFDTNYVDIYNPDHSLYKRVDLIDDSNEYLLMMYRVYDNLFDSDSDIEMLLIARSPKKGPATQWLVVMDENGVVQHKFDNGFGAGPHSAGGDFIVKTSAGVKMFLSGSGSTTGTIQVHSLPGTLALMVKAPDKEVNIAEAFPNPTTGKTVIPYALPEGISDGEIVVYGLNGAEVRRYRVTNTFNTLAIQDELSNGTYFYQLQTSAGTHGAKKLVVIR